MIKLGPSSTTSLGIGVWSTKSIPVNTLFGLNDGQQNINLMNVMEIKQEPEEYKPEVSDLLRSKWAENIKCARTKDEENLQAFEYQGSLFFRVTNTIAPNIELLVDYCKHSDCWKQHQDLIPHKDNNLHLDDTWVKCLICNIRFPSLLYVMKHAQFCNNSGSIVAMVAEHNGFDMKSAIDRIKPCVVYNSEIIKVNTPREMTERNICKCTKYENKLFCSCLVAKIKLEQPENNVCEFNTQAQSEYTVDGKMFIQTLKEKVHENAQCRNTFSTSAELSEHMETHTEEESKKCDPGMRHKCDQCPKSFTPKRLLKNHLKIHTREKNYRCDQLVNPCKSIHLKENVKVITAEKSYTCNECGLSLSRMSYFKTHMKIHTNKKAYKCNYCKASFSNSIGLKHHTKRHTGDMFRCHECGSSFLFKPLLVTHLMLHSGEKPFKCSQCERSFRLRETLKIHIRTHTGQKPFKCTICGNSFSQSTHLRTHIRTHTGEKPYKCNQCGKFLSQSSHLKAHLRVHTGEKPHECFICGNRFSHRNHLESHVRVHTGEKPYTCDHCEYSCSQRSAIVVHIRNRHMKKPYHCTLCKKSFTQSNDLKIHFETHTCKDCGKSFSQMVLLKRHMKTHNRKTMQDAQQEKSVTQPGGHAHMTRSRKKLV